LRQETSNQVDKLLKPSVETLPLCAHRRHVGVLNLPSSLCAQCHFAPGTSICCALQNRSVAETRKNTTFQLAGDREVAETHGTCTPAVMMSSTQDGNYLHCLVILPGTIAACGLQPYANLTQIKARLWWQPVLEWAIMPRAFGLSSENTGHLVP
jgi:hypothetical protein